MPTTTSTRSMSSTRTCSRSSRKKPPNYCPGWGAHCASGWHGPATSAPAANYCGRCIRSKAVRAWPARCAWVKWPTGWNRQERSSIPTPCPPSRSSRCKAISTACRRTSTHCVRLARPRSTPWCRCRPRSRTRIPKLPRPRPPTPPPPQTAPPRPPVPCPPPSPPTHPPPPPAPPGPAAAAEPAAAPAVAWRPPVSSQLAPLRVAANQSVRVRAQLLDRLVNQAGEVMISRARLDVRLGQFRSSLADLSGNLDGLRQQLRDIEVQAESQMQSRLALSKDSAAGFDPLEFDRFTRVQELTRMMAES